MAYKEQLQKIVMDNYDELLKSRINWENSKSIVDKNFEDNVFVLDLAKNAIDRLSEEDAETHLMELAIGALVKMERKFGKRTNVTKLFDALTSETKKILREVT